MISVACNDHLKQLGMVKTPEFHCGQAAGTRAYSHPVCHYLFLNFPGILKIKISSADAIFSQFPWFEGEAGLEVEWI